MGSLTSDQTVLALPHNQPQGNRPVWTSAQSKQCGACRSWPCPSRSSHHAPSVFQSVYLPLEPPGKTYRLSPVKIFWKHFSNLIYKSSLTLSFDDKLSMKQQVSKICQSTYLELRRISSVRHVLTVNATKTLVTSLVLSRLDYCNSLLSGFPQQLIDKLQKVQNCSARLIFKTSKCTHVSPLLAKLHWLQVAQRIDYKISS